MTTVRMRVADLHMRNWEFLLGGAEALWTSWGDVGEQEAANDAEPRAYYKALYRHMAGGGEVPPIEVGYWRSRDDDKVYVFNGHHRLTVARLLGHEFITVANSDDDEAGAIEDLC